MKPTVSLRPEMPFPPPPATPQAEPTPLDWLDRRTVKRVESAVRDRRVYRDDSGPIALVQTHISSVFLTSRHVFKFKRPVQLGFADFATLAERERYCRAEVELNGRLAEGVYLDVLPLCEGAGGTYALDGDGPIVDWCVVMERLPDRRTLLHRLREGGPCECELDALAQVLVDFHGRPESAGPTPARYGELAVLRENWDENFRQTEAQVGHVLAREDFDAIRAAVEGWLARNEALLHERVQGGYIRDGHGDLRCEHVYLLREPRAVKVIDCIEFNDRFRYGDVANDLAFLLMDLTAQGHPGLSRALLRRYVALSGDADLPRLVPFYACYRAYVRGKVTAFKLGDRNLSAVERKKLASRARAFFALALDFTRQMAPPVLVLVGGLMGTGKTVLAETLAAEAGMATFNSDALRKTLAGAAAAEGARAGFGAGIYDASWNERTYAALLERGAEELRGGRSVLLDASFGREADRRRALELARAYGVRAAFIECRLDEGQVRERLRRRERNGRSLSDGREALLEQQRDAFEPMRELPADVHRVVTTDAAPEALARELLPWLALPPPLFGVSV